MNPEEKKLLQDTFNLAEENNKMLHKVRGVQKRETVWKILKILVVIGIAVGAFYFLEPYINNIQKFIGDASSTINNFKNILPK